ncbi:hypothetical protein H5410_057356 [Solanum commersonii]|uniref:Uncharacterized protein n=1 Tax=Solanum commersonii TaxID=4109 RepID=A0A9J5WQL6_SOLCO|nr:hypothetical protein H5410_057356 [Solanum commersonii]
MPSEIPQVEFGEGRAYADLTTTSRRYPLDQIPEIGFDLLKWFMPQWKITETSMGGDRFLEYNSITGNFPDIFKGLFIVTLAVQVWIWKAFWQVKTPSNISCFVWLVVRDGCLTEET